MKNSPPSAGRVIGLLSLFLVASVVAGALFAGLFVPAIAAAGGAAKGSITWFNDLKAVPPVGALSQQSYLLASDGTQIARFYAENRREVPLNQISTNMRKAIIAIEDSRFYDHGGVDPIGLVRAAASDYLGNGSEVQGASTLTQQYIKNLYVEQAARRGDKAGVQAATARDVSRKVLEIRAAIDLEKTLSKDEILDNYLNIAYFGNGAYGIEAAAERYFSLHASQLSIEQSAMLAGVVQAPFTYDPVRHRKNATNRRNTVLSRMYELKMITRPQYTKAVASKIVLKPKQPQSGCIAAIAGLGFFCEYVRNLVASGADAFGKLGSTRAQRLDALDRGGLRIRTSIDLKVQKAALASIKKRVPIGDKSKVATAAVTVEPGTGHVLAMAQNKTFSNQERKLGSTAINYNVDTNLGGSAGFQTGSTFKAFTLAAWLKDGRGLRATIDASSTSIPVNDFLQCGSQHIRSTEQYEFGNSEPNAAKRLSVLDATANSVNTAFVNMETQLPLCDIAKTAESIGVHQAAPHKVCDDQSPLQIPDCIASMTLGPFSIAPLTMASGYAAFAADGTYCPPFPILSIKQADGNAVPLKAPSCEKDALDPDVAHGVTYALKGVLTHGTATNIKGQVPGHVAGKTGTTNESVDTWFVGYSKQRTTAVWVGDPTQYKRGTSTYRKSLNNRTIGGTYHREVFGATIAAPIWAGIMRTAVRGTDTSDWDAPPADMFGSSGSTASKSSDIPDVTGASVPEALGILTDAGFDPRIGRAVSSSVAAGFVASTSPGAGSSADAGSVVVVHPSKGSGNEGQGTTIGRRGGKKGPPKPPHP
jgi:membrane peptidoglycan carboxypeptidase